MGTAARQHAGATVSLKTWVSGIHTCVSGTCGVEQLAASTKSGFGRDRSEFGSLDLRRREPEFEDESTARTIDSLYRAAMQAQRPLGNRKSQTYAAGLPAACIVNAVERAKELIERFFRNTGSA